MKCTKCLKPIKTGVNVIEPISSSLLNEKEPMVGQHAYCITCFKKL